MKVASFLYNEENGKGRKVRLYADAGGHKGIVVDVEEMPELTKVFTTPQVAVAHFAGLREMSTKDWGATEVDWGDYAEYADLWPAHLTPWNERI